VPAFVAQADVQQHDFASSFLASNAKANVNKAAAHSALPSFDELLSDVACSGAASYLGWRWAMSLICLVLAPCC